MVPSACVLHMHAFGWYGCALQCVGVGGYLLLCVAAVMRFLPAGSSALPSLLYGLHTLVGCLPVTHGCILHSAAFTCHQWVCVVGVPAEQYTCHLARLTGRTMNAIMCLLVGWYGMVAGCDYVQ